jgi:LysR family nitrogen assimilation transcriptional regulator
MPSTLSLVERGVGYTLLSYGPARHLVDTGRLKSWSIVDPVLTRQLILATSSQRPTTTATRALAKMVRRQVQDLVQRGLWLSPAGRKRAPPVRGDAASPAARRKAVIP